MSRPPPASPPGRPGKPTPVRVLQEASEASAGPEPTPQRKSIVLDGVCWQVDVGGASLGGGRLGPVHLLMLCFTKGDDQDEDHAVREAWVVGDHLDGIPEKRLVAALHASEPRPERREPPGFFEELGGRRGR